MAMAIEASADANIVPAGSQALLLYARLQANTDAAACVLRRSNTAGSGDIVVTLRAAINGEAVFGPFDLSTGIRIDERGLIADFTAGTAPSLTAVLG